MRNLKGRTKETSLDPWEIKVFRILEMWTQSCWKILIGLNLKEIERERDSPLLALLKIKDKKWILYLISSSLGIFQGKKMC